MLNWPTLGNSPKESLVANAQRLCPVDEWLSNSPILDEENFLTRVSSLRFLSGPSAIPRLVVAVVLSAIQRSSGRTRAHIREEVLKRVPTLAHGDPAPAVEVKIDIVSVETAAFHAGPTPVLRGSRSAVRCYSATKIWQLLAFDAAARSTKAIFQAVWVSDFLPAALTGANPPNSDAFVLRSGEYGETTKFLTREVLRFSHNFIVQEVPAPCLS